MRQVRRLYKQFAPNKYIIDLVPDKANMIFDGTAIIEGKKTGRPTKRLTLHAKDLKIVGAKILQKNRSIEQELKINRVINHKAYDELRLHTDETLYPGEYKIELSFKGRITRPMNGLYPCYFKDGDKDEIILATQFESHHAREVFPCIDEPEAKAVFSLSLTSLNDDTVIANTEVESQTIIGPNLVKTVFQETPRMSTYLLAFTIGKIECLSRTTQAGVTVRAFAKPSDVSHTAFALEVAVKTLDFFNNFFGIDYPLSKCDLLALPDFASGAMENWGLITFREQAMLVDPKNTSLIMKQYVANVVAHELTHQWFGNLVTMRWWNDLWLNESFATLMSYVAEDALFPEWNMWMQFISDEQNAALRLDALESTHSINVAIRHPDEIRTIFDNISYEKGASVLLMLMRFLGEKDFQEGLKLYLKRHAYSNTESADLWQAWEEVSGKKVGNFMDSWTKQSGFPLVNVNFKHTKLNISQQRFYINPQATKKATIWPIPLFSEPGVDRELLTKQAQELNLPNQFRLPIINHDRNAFARVIYAEENLNELAETIRSGKLMPLDRMGLLSDSFEAAKAGMQNTTESLKLLSSYKAEDNVVVWEIIAANLASLRSVMDDEQLRENSNTFIDQLTAIQYQRLGWDTHEGEAHFDQLLRPIILSLKCVSENQNAVEEAAKRFKNVHGKPLYPDIRSVVYTTVARHGGAAEFNTMVKMHNASSNSEERLALAAGITNFRQPKLINQALAMIKSDRVRLQDISYWLSDSFANRYSKDFTWQWLKDNWNWLKQNIGSDLSFYMMPRIVARAYSDLNFIPEFKAFFEHNQSSAYNRPLEQAIETITWQALWRQRDLASLQSFFSEDKAT
ncbi:M1 family metallopeptidase [Patescibacteria group bacterium]|nr:M1 family metallopeptidase [Patescibacteria group bacterium]